MKMFALLCVEIGASSIVNIAMTGTSLTMMVAQVTALRNQVLYAQAVIIIGVIPVLKFAGMAEMLAITAVMMGIESMEMDAVLTVLWNQAINALEEILGILTFAENCVVMALTWGLLNAMMGIF